MKTDLILLASGSSRRFGSNKLLYYINGYPMYMHTIWNAMKVKENRENHIGNIYFVSKYTALLKEAENYDVIPVLNMDSNEGISASIRHGVNASGNDAYLFLLCDQPFLTADSIQRLITVYEKSSYSIACMANDAFIGIPAVFSKEHRNDLLSLSGDSGGKSILKRYDPHIGKHHIADMQELRDIDRKDADGTIHIY